MYRTGQVIAAQAGIVVIMIIRGLLSTPDGGGLFCFIAYYKLLGRVKIVLRGLVRNDLNWGNTMRGLRKYLTPFAPDQSGAVSVLFELEALW